MAPFREPSPLENPQQERLYEIAEQFEEAWRLAAPGDEVDLARFLPAEAPLREAVLHELVKTELSIRGRRGQKASLDHYLARFPELGSLDVVSPQLVYEEYRARLVRGDRPRLSEYRSRFPAQFSEVQRLVQQDSVVGPAATTEGIPLGSPTPRDISVRGLLERDAPAGLGYKLLEPLRTADGRVARGAFGEVWRAEAPGGVTVAVKIINVPPGDPEGSDLSPFAVEKKALELIKNFNHPCLVRPNAYWVDDGRLFIAMELADGSLQDRLHASPRGVPREELLGYFKDVAEALDFLHERNLRHRDVKPPNVLLYQGHAKLADFGLARAVERSTIISDDVFGGTAGYIAPEVWNGALSRHSDQFSLAVSYTHLRLGRRPFKGKTQPEQMRSLFQDEPDLEGLPGHERRVLRRALDKDPHRRFANCRAFVAALEEAVRQESGGSGVSRRRRLVLGLVLLALLGAAAWVALTWLPRGPAAPLGIKEAAKGPVWLDRGGETTVDLLLDPADSVDSVRLSAPDAERVGITATDAGPGAAPGTRRLHLKAGHTASLGAHRLTVRAAGAGWSGDAPLPEVRVLFLPPDFKGLEDRPDWAQQDGDGRWYYRRIARHQYGESVEFVLVPWKPYQYRGPRGSAEEAQLARLPAFYIMKDKVTRKLYASFAEPARKILRDRKWAETKGQDDHPVLGVTWEDAATFAVKVFGGKLPEVLQWEKAAGRFIENRDASPWPEGPYRGRWAEGKFPRPKVAVGGLPGPLPVGAAVDDVSFFGCRDMAGNGEELMREVIQRANNQYVDLRGRNPGDGEPFQFRFVEDPEFRGQLGWVNLAAPHKSGRPGFRVVIEVQ